MKKQDIDPLHYSTCQKCGNGKATAVVNVTENKRLGWYCAECQNFSEAILRETTWRNDSGK
jgi:hypothetical protein